MSQTSNTQQEVMAEIEKEKGKHQSMLESLKDVEEVAISEEGESNIFGGWKIVTGLDDRDSAKKAINKALHGYLQDMENSMLVIFGGNSNAQYPEVQISATNTTSPDFDNSDAKFFSMIVPVKEGEVFRYFLRKGVGKAKNETILELTESEINEIRRVAKEIYFPFLESVQGNFFNFVKDFNDKLPESVTIREIGKSRKVVFKIDEGDLVFKKGKRTAMPNMSIRVWEFGNRNGWFATKSGVTMSCFNFFLLVNAAFANFVPDVKSLVKNYFKSITQLKEMYAQTDDDMDDEPLVQ
jgi:hypothetical protein